MIEINITDKQRERANKLYEFNILNNSVTKGKGNVVGALGEIIVLEYYNEVSEYVGSKDYDLIIKGMKIDVKTKKQNYPPAPHHTFNIFAFNTTQKCDYYCFVVILSDLKIGWIVGWEQKDEFFNKATFKKEGQIDDSIPNCNWKFKGDCYCLKLTQLNQSK